MDIIIRAAYKAIQLFELKGLPDLVVLTGENGTGKTQLLEYLYYGSRLSDKGELAPTGEGDDNFSDMPKAESTGSITGEGELEVVLPCEISAEGKRFQNIVYRGVQVPSVDVGGKYDLKKYDEKKFFKQIIATCYENYPEIISMDLVETLKEIQTLK